ncbi:MAG: penicillin-binding protein activator [Gallionella sp.]|nr:penicillin-binding protein activator [Gallionella sp.]
MQVVASESKWLRGLLIAALYVSLFGCATPPATTSAVPAPAHTAKAPTTTPASAQPVATTGVVTEPAVEVVSSGEAVPNEPTEHHIALILPLKSAAFGKAAEAVQQGFMAAAAQQANGLPVRIYPCNDEKTEVLALYQRAIKAGALSVAGPLTRNGVVALATSSKVAVPTLALNVIDAPRADQLYFFGLPADQEAHQVAELATKAGLLSATIVRTDTALSKRLAQAFSGNWQRSGGIILSEIVYSGDTAPLRLIPTDPGNMVFLAAEVDKARLLRPYISNLLPVYASSQVFSGNANNLVNFDLAEVRFVDMPWVLQPDHPAVMVYQRVVPPLPQDMERLYALGIDAYRLLQIFYQHDTINSLPMDGVTGKIGLNGHLLEREAMPAVLRQGQGIPLDGRPQLVESKPQQ